jgi:hypothetical protein
MEYWVYQYLNRRQSIERLLKKRTDSMVHLGALNDAVADVVEKEQPGEWKRERAGR